MTLAEELERRARHVAFDVNAHLPEERRHAIQGEERRVAGDVLRPLGLSRRRVLILGGAGYVGTVLTRHLLARSYEVRGFDNLLFNNRRAVVPFLDHPCYEFVFGDLTSESALRPALEGVSDVVLLAGLVGDPITKKYPDAARRINDEGYDLVLDVLTGLGLNKVVFVSTCSNYGFIKGDHAADEDFELKPLSSYAKSKLRMEKAVLALNGSTDFVPTVLRFATAFGLSPRMRFDLTISEFTRAMFLGEDLMVHDAETWRPYCHVEDFSETIRRVLEAPRTDVAFEVFNAGGDANNFTKQMVVDAILEELPGALVRYRDKGADPRNYRVSFTKVREQLLFEPTRTVGDGIRELIAALRQGRFRDISQPPNFFGNHEIDY